MNRRFYDLNVNGDIENVKFSINENSLCEFSLEPEEILKQAEILGWDGLCMVRRFDKNFGKFCDDVSNLKYNLDILIGAEIEAPIEKNARKAIELADVILVDGGDEIINREASECWEADILSHPERNSGRDFMSQRNSGVDHIMARFMQERFIAMEVNFAEVLNSYGISRARILGRMMQNVILARKYNTPLVITSGAQDRWGLRSARELIAFGKCLGMTDLEAKDAVSETPARIVKKAGDRKNPSVILKGLEVLDWGKSKPNEKKRMYGWY